MAFQIATGFILSVFHSCICFQIQVGQKGSTIVLFFSGQMQQPCMISTTLQGFSVFLALSICRCIHALVVGVQTGTESLKSSKNSRLTSLKLNVLNNAQLSTLSGFQAKSSWPEAAAKRFICFFPLTVRRCVQLNSSTEMIVSDRLLLLLLGPLSAHAVHDVSCEKRC